ncbi:MAG: DUF1887 family protein [Clostridiales bacterium]|nr:DUF1887 family protein [Clostridiales bacterium]
MKTLIELFDEQAIHNVLATEVFHPDTTVIICPETVNEHKQESLRHYFHARRCDAHLVFIKADMMNANLIAERLREVIRSHEDCAVDIAGGTDAALFAAGSICSEMHIPAFTYSRRRNTFYEIQAAPFAHDLPCNVHLRVSDSFLMAGGSMLKGRMDNQALDSIKPMIDPFFHAYKRFRKDWTNIITYMQKVSKNSEEFHVEGPKSVHAVRNTVIEADPKVLRTFERIGMIHNLVIGDNSVSFTFTNELSRFALRDVGSVLELYVWKACMDANVFDDVCLSAIVNWEGDIIRSDSVTNEIDVACTRGVIPLFISCKTCDIKTEALNELAILRDRFGAPTARALIITSDVSSHDRAAMRRRASELDIAVIDEQNALKHNVLVDRLISLSEMRDIMK